ncbi:MAG: GNAT family N-acetyltransferase [Chloroflexaceae bacterium]|jgi:ribosomal protein S18 acetylase RimI-like enzyme|nr:GNAT family N-acetyltransferase [Chloroflexaceae bacterium]
MVIDSTIPSLADEPLSPVVMVRMAAMSDIPSILRLHREAFADKFGGAFGNNGVDRGMEAMAAAWRRQGMQALRGMYVAVVGQEVVATATLRTWEMSSDDGGAAELAFQQVLGLWGATRSIFALSLLDHRIERGEGFITDVAVLNPYRRRGIAQLLLKRAEEDARLRQKRYLGLYVSSANAGARALYQRMGFYDVKQRHSWLTRVMFGQRSWVYMRKDLHSGMV